MYKSIIYILIALIAQNEFCAGQTTNTLIASGEGNAVTTTNHGNPWINLHNIKAQDSVCATWSMPWTTPWNGSLIWDTVIVSDFQFNIPPDAVVEKIVSTIRRNEADTVYVATDCMDELIQVGVPSIGKYGNNMAYPDTVYGRWTNALKTIDYLSTADHAGNLWKASEVNSRDFQLKISVKSIGPATYVVFPAIDYVSVKIYYRISSTPSNPISPNPIDSTNHNTPSVFYPLLDYNYYIRAIGSTKIYNSEGRMIKELTTPSDWDGSDQSGQLVPMGQYYIITNDKEKSALTVLK
jgi:hypothetical protein